MCFLFPFSLVENKSTKIEIRIPSLEVQETKKEFNGNVLLLKQNLESLNINDSIILKNAENRYFYKVRDIFYKEEKEILQNMDSKNIIYLVEDKTNEENLQLVVVAIYTGKLTES